MPILGIIASANQQGRGGGPESGYDALASVTLSASASSIDFVGIPTGYKHLQVRIFARLSSNADYSAWIRLGNSAIDTGANYNWHAIRGDGSTATTLANANQTEIFAWSAGTQINNVGSVAVIDILDYQNTNKFKTIRSLGGGDNNGNGYATLFSGAWRSTTAINTINITPQSSTWAQYSSFALYGIK
jgi:hypothetical protein